MAEQRAFVCGHPITHSRSPLIHGHWLRRYGIPGSYESRDVAPEDFISFLQGLAGTYVGGNITIPHKESAWRLVDRRDAAAEAIGAVNTLWFEEGRLCGGNTDTYGFTANLDAAAPDWQAGGTATVLGAGGAARAVLHALRERGVRNIRLVNRTLARAEALAGRFGGGIEAHGFEVLPRLLADTALLVNTTSLGMEGGGDLTLDLAPLPGSAVVTDIVYVPLRTPLLAAAAARGLRTVDGLGMLLHQAVPGFERWFGIRPEVTEELRALVVADLERHA